MGAIVVPELLAAARRDADDPAFAAWVDALPETVSALAGRWGLRLGSPYEPGGNASWVTPAMDPAGRPCVLKVGWVHDEARDEAAGLRAWAGHGAVEVYRVETSAPTFAMLLERCEPGTTLRAAATGGEQDEIVAGLLRRLWAATAPVGHPFRSLASMCAGWADRYEAPARLDPGLVRAGLELFRELPATADTTVLLATDLHAGNVLAARREPWLMIDPKPYLGDPAYDVLQHLINNTDRLAADPAGLARRMAGLTGTDPDRVTAWLFARAVQQSPSWPELVPVAVALAPRVTGPGPITQR
jgi:streptomycin 6-kinase